MYGYLKINRIKIKNFAYYHNSQMFHLFMHLLLNANYEDKPWQDIIIKRGEFVCSMATLSENIGMSKDTVRRMIIKLEKIGEVHRHCTNQYTILTMLRFEDYQDFEEHREHFYKPQRRKARAKPSRNEDITDENQSQTTKEEKNKTKEQENRNGFISELGFNMPLSDPVIPTLEEIIEHCEARQSRIEPELFFDYHEKMGWRTKKGNPISNWKAVLKNWESSMHLKAIMEIKNALY